MRLLQINSYNYLSTGKIMMDISALAEKSGIESFTACPAARTMYAHKAQKQLFIGTIIGRNIHRIISEYSGLHGYGSFIDTILFLRKVKRLCPDIVHLHNIHGSYINIPLLFNYLKNNPQIKLVWTFHDCWPFTGGCPHYEILKCEKWKKQCYDCEYKGYPKGKRDITSYMYRKKKNLFLSVPNLQIVTPSKWLSNQVEQSFLRIWPVHVINNGIDLSVFRPTESDFKTRYNLEGKKIILGIASTWSYRKGLDIFIKLAELIPDYMAIVMVGVTDDIANKIPEKIISIYRTNDIKELVGIYSSSDVFFNPTREDTFPTVNIEALACGTPVVTFASGGSPEIIDDTCGRVCTEENFYEAIDETIRRNIPRETCRNRAARYSKEEKLKDYVSLYREISKGENE